MLSKLKPKSEFNKNVLTLVTGTTIAQAIPIAITPILTRLYTPEDFGVFALFFAISAIFGSIANGLYDQAIILPKKDEDAINIFALGIIVNICITSFLFVLILLFNDYFVKLLDNEEIKFWLYFIPLAVFFIGFFNLLNYFNNRKKNYKDIRDATVLKALVLAVVQLCVGFIKQGATGLISGLILSFISSNTRLLKNILKNKVLLLKVSKVKIIAQAKRYKNFPKINSFTTLANILASYLPLLLLPKLFSLQISGQFSLAQNLIALPSALVGKSISQVFFQKISENRTNKIENMPLLISTIKKLFFIALPFSVIIFLFAPFAFGIIFGKSWVVSGEIAQYLSLTLLISFMVSPISITLIAYEKLKILATWQFLYLFSGILLFVLTYYFDLALKEFLFYYVVYQYILYAIYLIIIIKTIQISDKMLFIKKVEK